MQWCVPCKLIITSISKEEMRHDGFCFPFQWPEMISVINGSSQEHSNAFPGKPVEYMWKLR